MDPKTRLHHKFYIQILRRMSPESRLLKNFKLTQFARDLFLHGLRKRFPHLSEAELKIAYMATGSVASSLQREPRATHDIDLVVSMRNRAKRNSAFDVLYINSSIDRYFR